MTRILALVAIAVLLFATPIAADIALDNQNNAPNTTAAANQQETFTETAGDFAALGPPALLVMVVGLLLAGVRGIGSGGMR